MPIVLDIAAKRAITLVEFSFGSGPTFVRYTDVDGDVTFETNTYLSMPTMEIRMAPYTGLLKERPVEITLDSDAFTDPLSLGEAHAPVKVRVVVLLESSNPGTPPDQVMELYKGQVSITIRNASGNADRIKLKCTMWKQESNRPSGLQCNSQCFYQFQGKGCVVDSPPGSLSFISAVTPSIPATVVVTALTVLGTLLTTAADPPGGPFTDDLFHRGFLEFDGLKVGIREWNRPANIREFLLEKPAPSSWVGQVLTLHQGCDKSILTCENRYANGDFFGGMGIGIRDYNPIFEVRT